MKGLEIAGYIFFAIDVALVVLLCAFAIRWFFVRKKEDSQKTIREPNFYAIVGVLGSLLVLVFIAFAMFDTSMTSNSKDERMLAAIMFSFMLYLCVFVGFSGINWKITVEDDCFYFTNSFGERKQYGYDEVTIKDLRACYRVYKGKKHIVGVSYTYPNYNALEQAKYKYDGKHSQAQL